MSNLKNDISKDIKFRLNFAHDIEFEGLTIRNFKIGEIEEIGIETFQTTSSIVIVEKTDIKFLDLKEEDKDKTLFELLPYADDGLIYSIILLLDLFTTQKWKYDIKFNVFRSNEKKIITYIKLEKIFNLIKVMYWIERGNKTDSLDPSKAVDEETKKIVEELAQAKEKNKKRKKTQITLNGIIVGVASTTHYSFDDIENKLTMYQLMSIFFSNENRDHYQYIMQSIYNGNYDTKNFKPEDIHYCKEL